MVDGALDVAYGLTSKSLFLKGLLALFGSCKLPYILPAQFRFLSVVHAAPNVRFCQADYITLVPQRMTAPRPWCCSPNCSMSIKPCLSSRYNVFRFQVQMTERDRRRSEFSACGKLAEDQQLTSSVPNRRSHEVRRISHLRNRFWSSWPGVGEQPHPHNPRIQRKNPVAAGSGERFCWGKWRREWDPRRTFSILRAFKDDRRPR
jgi:hypothetical protein